MTYIVNVTRDDGYWTAEGDSPSFATFARTLSKLREYVADAIALGLEVERMDAGERDPHVDRRSIDVQFKLRLPADARRAVDRARRARERLATDERDAAEATLTAVAELTEAGLSHRDAAEVLDLSHQRVGQLARQRR